MQIITKAFNKLSNNTLITIYGPNIIPIGHFLYGKSLRRHGFYTRELTLSNKLTIRFIIFRFREILISGGKQKSVTYSLLPFYISPYQRHINEVIDKVLQLFFLEHRSKLSISRQLDIGIYTINRWITKFAIAADEINSNIEIELVAAQPGYRAAANAENSISKVAKNVFKKMFILVKEKTLLIEYGIISFINLLFKPFFGKRRSILTSIQI